VKKGQLLAEIDAPALVLDERLATNGVLQAACLLREAQARVSGTVAEVVAAQGAVRLREAEVTTAKVSLESWKKQCDRLKQLSDNNAVPQQTVNEAQNHYLAAEAQVAAAVAGVENGKANVEIKKGNMAQAEAAVETAKANVEAAKLGLEKARLALSQTRVTAPFDGIVTRRNLSAGDFVRPDQSTAIHSQLFTLVRVDVIRVVVEVPEQGIPLVEPGVLAEVTFHALPESRFTGKVARVGFVANPKTGTMRAEIDVPNPGGKLRPGMSGVAELKLGKGNVGPLRVPVGAVLTHLPPLTDENANAAVYVYRDGKARLTRVRVGKGDGKETEVISGLTAEDRVVVNPVGLLPPALQEIPVRVEAPEPKK
jgi:RND family efflux transporter MFP subunit